MKKSKNSDLFPEETPTVIDLSLETVKTYPRLRTPANYDHTKEAHESNFGPLQTIPNQAPPLQVVLDRVQRGQPITQKPAIYDTAGKMIDLRKLDLTERQALSARMADEFAQKKAAYDAALVAKSEADKALKQAQENEQYERFKARLAQEQNPA